MTDLSFETPYKNGLKHGTGYYTFSDGNKQAVMAVFKFQDGKIISLETGATNMPK